jgi:hypothetical protein
MNGHAPHEHRTNSGQVRILCECGWSTVSYGVSSIGKSGRVVTRMAVGLDPAYRDHGRHAAELARAGTDD